ncbi:uncharacterized protein Z518_10572 [Rhinocladiella mackenziei CBS 650.93]|uniref:HIG1 domain-containing protein n=1 Tax=Rhinocladiella mackenziei CBS 650.93 TaxID=1442369 RepID=A0A0D2GQ38_9EURO|nr:uncharacterized protein Z518_10572 [Rhinocladiella mackenziei CBS 650.93]KIX00433.1 hypothetical protein Z518_10572 [Rhinocladiella mackenziei CBS 650.93]
MSDSDSSLLSPSNLPSSMDQEFFEENRWQKLWRKLRQEPLIPIGCAATCYALYMASKSIRAGDHHQTNRMFRARIYAQGFTLVALVAGSVFYKDERLRRKAFEEKLEEKKTAEKREKWLKELEARDEEDRLWREKVEKETKAAMDQARDVKEKAEKMARGGKESVSQAVQQAVSEGEGKNNQSSSWQFWNKSVKEEVISIGWGPGMWGKRTKDAWKRF